MLRTSLVAAVLALAIWYAFGVIGPYPVFRTAASVDVVRVDQLNQLDEYRAYMQQRTAGTWDSSKPTPSAPSSLRFLLWQGINWPNTAISGVIATFGAVVVVFGLSGIWEQARKARWDRPWSRQYAPNGRVDRQEERTGERRPVSEKAYR